MVKIDDPRTRIARLIFKSYEDSRNDERRPHLGASVIGRECNLQIWMMFRWFGERKFPGRMLRLFERGNREEAWLVRDLRAAGMEVRDCDPETGKQFEYSKLGGHFGGSGDAQAIGVPGGGRTKIHVCEFKTHNAKSFAALVKDGVQKAKPEHYSQIQLYMAWEGTDRGLYIAVNKNTDNIHIERIRADAKCVSTDEEKAKAIIFGAGKPSQISKKATFWKCKFCDFKKQCHEGKTPDKNCRTCVFSKPHGDGTWRCGFSRRAWDDEQPVLDLERQKVGCDNWEGIKV